MRWMVTENTENTPGHAPRDTPWVTEDYQEAVARAVEQTVKTGRMVTVEPCEEES